MTQTTRLNSPAPLPQEPITALREAGGVLGLMAVLGLTGIVGTLWQRKPLWLALAGASGSVLAGILYTFRQPRRDALAAPGVVVAPCDGEVISVARVYEPRFLKCPAHEIAIRVRPGDMQAICAPISGVVHYRRLEPRGQAGTMDDVLWIGTRAQEGDRVLVKLRASHFWRTIPSFVGRRVITRLDLEDASVQGQVFGHLPLGGEVRVYVPTSARVMPMPRTKPRAAETALAQF